MKAAIGPGGAGSQPARDSQSRPVRATQLSMERVSPRLTIFNGWSSYETDFGNFFEISSSFFATFALAGD